MDFRIVLERRNEEEMPFLMSLLNQCLKDHPNSFALSMAHLLILRYVFKERSQATTQEKLSKLQSSTSAVDSKYVLFAVNKKTVQEGVSDSLAKVVPFYLFARTPPAARAQAVRVANLLSFFSHGVNV
eukprot:2153340-Rhodomonas_salina.1